MYVDTTKGHEGTFKGDGIVMYLDQESSFTSVFVCQLLGLLTVNGY